jgi:hypothetical protein
MPMPRSAVVLRSRFQKGMFVAWHGRSITCVNQMGRTKSKHLGPRHGRGTEWERHGVCELTFTLPALGFPLCVSIHQCPILIHLPPTLYNLSKADVVEQYTSLSLSLHHKCPQQPIVTHSCVATRNDQRHDDLFSDMAFAKFRSRQFGLEMSTDDKGVL